MNEEALEDIDRSTYAWQMWVRGHGEQGQSRLKGATVLVSRCGGLGGVVAYQLAAAGVGGLVLAHAGRIKESDLNRQLLMTHDRLGTSRMDSIVSRLRDLNPRMRLEGVSENVHEGNAERLVSMADVVVDCAPLFEERFLLNREAVRQGKPMVESAVYELTAQITTIVPGETPCLACLVPEKPKAWKREFPVFGAVSGTIGSMAAMETIKLIAGFGDLLTSRMMILDLERMQTRTLSLQRREDCAVCGSLSRGE